MRLNQYSDTQPFNSVASVLSCGLVEESSLRGDRGFLSLHVSGSPRVLSQCGWACCRLLPSRWRQVRVPRALPSLPCPCQCSSCLEGAMTRKRFFTDTSGEKKKIRGWKHEPIPNCTSIPDLPDKGIFSLSLWITVPQIWSRRWKSRALQLTKSNSANGAVKHSGF